MVTYHSSSLAHNQRIYYYVVTLNPNVITLNFWFLGQKKVGGECDNHVYF